MKEPDVYLGDAVYASDLEGSIGLRLNSHDDQASLIVLEPVVLANFIRWLASDADYLRLVLNTLKETG